MSYFLLVLTGLSVGVISSFFGVGGGIVIIPMLYMIFPDISPQTVIGSSLTLICMNSTLNARNFAKAGKKPDLKSYGFLAPAMVLGVIAGGKLVLLLSPKIIKMIFSITLFIIVARMTFSKKEEHTDEEWEASLSKKPYLKFALTGLFGGITAGLTGLGGGAVMVPAFITALKMPIKWVSVYSNWVMVLGTMAGAITMATADLGSVGVESFARFQVGQVNFAVSIILFVGAFFTSKVGVKLTEVVDPGLSKKLFSILLLVFGIKIFISAL